MIDFPRPTVQQPIAFNEHPENYLRKTNTPGSETERLSISFETVEI